MRKRARNGMEYMVVLTAIALTVGCGGAAKTSGAVVTASDSQEEVAYDYQQFAPLPEPVREGTVPFLMGPGGTESVSCFQKVEGIAPQEGGTDLLVLFQKHAEVAEAAIAKWFAETLAPDSVSASTVRDWKIEFDDTVALEVGADKLRFVEGPECIQQSTGWLAEDLHVVTALYGAHTFRFEADPPLKAEVKEAIVGGVQSLGMMIESDDLKDYEPLLDDEGKPKLDAKKQPLYTAPDGSLVPEKEVPPPEKRTMSQWTLKSEQPLFFAFHELSEDAWRAEMEDGVCDVVLIWGEATPRAPECEQYTASTFLAKKLDTGDVEVTVKTGEESKKVTVGFGSVETLQANDRTILWISPEEAGEGLGVKLKLNSLVLNP